MVFRTPTSASTPRSEAAMSTPAAAYASFIRVAMLPHPMDAKDLRWFHTIDLGGGVVTDGEDDSPRKLGWLHLPDLRGKTVLDVGAWDGFFSFAAERAGAARVVAVDPACWNPPAWGERGWGTRRGFDFAREALGSAVEPVDLPSLDELGTLGTFDVVL